MNNKWTDGWKTNLIPTGEALQKLPGHLSWALKKRRFFQSEWEEVQGHSCKKDQNRRRPPRAKAAQKVQGTVSGWLWLAHRMCAGRWWAMKLEKWRPHSGGTWKQQEQLPFMDSRAERLLTCIISPTQNNLEEWFRKCDPGTGSISTPGNLLEMQLLKSIPDLRNR